MRVHFNEVIFVFFRWVFIADRLRSRGWSRGGSSGVGFLLLMDDVVPMLELV
jgi:hypothetical protein